MSSRGTTDGSIDRTNPVKISQAKRATALEITILFYGRKPLHLPVKREAYDRRREALTGRYAQGMTIKEVALSDGCTSERTRQILVSGLRTLRHPAFLSTWKMLVAERPGLATSQLAEDAFGYSLVHEELLAIAAREKSIGRHFVIL